MVERSKLKLCVDIDWDINSALGDTVGEKFESFYLLLTQVSQLLEQGWMQKSPPNRHWLLASPELLQIFEVKSWILTPPTDRAHPQ